MTGQQQIVFTDAQRPNGAAQNQSGGINLSYNGDGTCFVGFGGAVATPANWYNTTPTPGIGNLFWIKAIDTGGTGTAGALTGPSISGFTNLASLSLQASIPSGNGSRTYSYQISSSPSGSPVVASGTGTLNTAHP